MGNFQPKMFGESLVTSLHDIVDAPLDTLKGLTSGHFNYSNLTLNPQSLFSESAQQKLADAAKKMAQEKLKEQIGENNYYKAADAGNAIKNVYNSLGNSNANGNLGQSVSNTARNATYGNNMGQSVTPPSQLLKIGNPNVKMAIASSSGQVRKGINTSLNFMDVNSHQALMGGGMANPSKSNNAAGTGGAAGVQNSNDNPSNGAGEQHTPEVPQPDATPLNQPNAMTPGVNKGNQLTTQSLVPA